MKVHAQRSGLLDSGAYYAPKTQTAANGERILWGWITEKRPDEELRKAGWAGCMSLPRVLSLDADDRLVMRPARETESLRGKEFSLPSAGAATERGKALRELHIENLCAELEVEIRPGPFAMSLVDGEQAFLTMEYDPGKAGGEFTVNGVAWEAQGGNAGNAAVRIFIDGSVVELFVNGHWCHTARIYRAPAKPLSAQIAEGALANLVSLKAWQLRPISPDRLTGEDG
jgi:beta-fructofuranosidase